jgi:excisionase family DNA binding protein
MRRDFRSTPAFAVLLTSRFCSIRGVEVSDLTPQQAAGELGCSRTLVYRLIERGELPGTYELPGSKRKRIPRGALDALKDRHRVRACERAPSYEPQLTGTQRCESGSFADGLDATERGEAA